MKSMRDVDMGRPIDSALMKLPNVTSTVEGEYLSNTGTNGVFSNIEIKEQPFLSSGSLEMLSLNNLSLTTPDRKRTLITKLNLTLKFGSNLLIVGNSGKKPIHDILLRIYLN